MIRHFLSALVVANLLAACASSEPPSNCAPDNAGLTLPEGFCAQVVADSVGFARHIAVAPNGDIFVALRDSNGGVMALRDLDGDGVAEQREKFGARGGTGIAFFDNYLYFATDTSVIRWPWAAGPTLGPAGSPVPLPRYGD